MARDHYVGLKLRRATAMVNSQNRHNECVWDQDQEEDQGISNTHSSPMGHEKHNPDPGELLLLTS
jgi:hypothetical protein